MATMATSHLQCPCCKRQNFKTMRGLTQHQTQNQRCKELALRKLGMPKPRAVPHASLPCSTLCRIGLVGVSPQNTCTGSTSIDTTVRKQTAIETQNINIQEGGSSHSRMGFEEPTDCHNNNTNDTMSIEDLSTDDSSVDAFPNVVPVREFYSEFLSFTHEW